MSGQGEPLRELRFSVSERRVVERAYWRTVLNNIRRNPLALAGITIFLIVVLLALFAPWVAPYDPLEVNMKRKLLPPGGENLLGTDELGRDLLSRCIYGYRISLRAAVNVLSLASLVGIALGSTAGYLGGRIDNLIMRFTDMVLAFPGLLLALAIAGALGPSITNATISLAAVWWPWYARLIRGQLLSAKENLYVDAAIALGAKPLRILVRHLLPNCFTPILVLLTMDVGVVVVMMASLSFLGLGARPPEPELGYMIARGRLYFMNQPWVAAVPGAAIFLLALSSNLMGDAWRDILDPRTQSH
ncbi:MAG: ABC transporter permease [Anaerolineae bacterium]